MLYFQGRGGFQLQRRFEMPQLKCILMQIVPAHIPSMSRPRVCRRGTHTDGRDTQIQVRLGLDCSGSLETRFTFSPSFARTLLEPVDVVSERMQGD